MGRGQNNGGIIVGLNEAKIHRVRVTEIQYVWHKKDTRSGNNRKVDSHLANKSDRSNLRVRGLLGWRHLLLDRILLLDGVSRGYYTRSKMCVARLGVCRIGPN